MLAENGYVRCLGSNTTATDIGRTMKEELRDDNLAQRFKRAAAEIAQLTSPRRPSFAASGDPARTRPGRRRWGRAWARPWTVRQSLALAAGVAVLTIGVAYAASTIITVPTRVTVTGPDGQGIPTPSVPGNDIVPGTPRTVTFAQAQRDVAFHILVLPASLASPEQWQIIPPTTTKSGGPITPGEVMTPQVFVTYLLAAGPTVTISEFPVKPGTPLTVYVKWYGASRTHRATVDGFQIVYSATGSNVSDVVLGTTTGLELWMSSSQELGDPSSEPAPMTLAEWESLIAALAPSPAGAPTPSPTPSPTASPSPTGESPSPSPSATAAPSSAPTPTASPSATGESPSPSASATAS